MIDVYLITVSVEILSIYKHYEYKAIDDNDRWMYYMKTYFRKQWETVEFSG